MEYIHHLFQYSTVKNTVTKLSPIAKKGGRDSLVVRTREKEKQFGEQLASLYHNKFLPKLYVVGVGSRLS